MQMSVGRAKENGKLKERGFTQQRPETCEKNTTASHSRGQMPKPNPEGE